MGSFCGGEAAIRVFEAVYRWSSVLCFVLEYFAFAVRLATGLKAVTLAL